MKYTEEEWEKEMDDRWNYDRPIPEKEEKPARKCELCGRAIAGDEERFCAICESKMNDAWSLALDVVKMEFPQLDTDEKALQAFLDYGEAHVW